jgi:hypothetical protein
VPGSFVLSRTIEALNDFIPNLTKNFLLSKTGTYIEIINNGASYDVIPNRPIKNHLNDYDPNPWETTGEAIKGKIQLKLMFLAGFLDIINSLNSAIGNIQIP